MTYEQHLEKLAARRGEAVEVTRVYADRRISDAVRDSLRGIHNTLDNLDDELRAEAGRRLGDARAAGRAAAGVRSFTHTGAPLR